MPSIQTVLLSFLLASLSVHAAFIRRELPTPADLVDSKAYLSALTISVDSNDPPYSRDLFKTWITISGKCDTRETVLIRDGVDVVTDASCASVSGTWLSVYDGVSFNVSSKLDIDHLVPLKEAWVSGARNWTPDQRQAYANDVVRPQLLAVSASSNRSKGDRDPANWMPPMVNFHCTYVQAWVSVKYYYNLTVDAVEATALQAILDGNNDTIAGDLSMDGRCLFPVKAATSAEARKNIAQAAVISSENI